MSVETAWENWIAEVNDNEIDGVNFAQTLQFVRNNKEIYQLMHLSFHAGYRNGMADLFDEEE